MGYNFLMQILLIPRPFIDLVMTTKLVFGSRLIAAAICLPVHLLAILAVGSVYRRLLHKKLG